MRQNDFLPQDRNTHKTMELTSLAVGLNLISCESTDSSSDSDREDAPLAHGRIIPMPAIASSRQRSTYRSHAT